MRNTEAGGWLEARCEVRGRVDSEAHAQLAPSGSGDRRLRAGLTAAATRSEPTPRPRSCRVGAVPSSIVAGTT